MVTGNRREMGLEVLRELTGRALPADAIESDALMATTVDHLFGEIWSRPGMPLAERSLVTCAVLVALGREHEQKIHFANALHIGITPEKLGEVILHVAHYAGWPVAISARNVLRQVIAERAPA